MLTLLAAYFAIEELLSAAEIEFNSGREDEDDFIWIETDQVEEVKDLLGMDCTKDFFEGQEVNIYES